MSILLVILWIIVTLFVGLIGGVLAKRYGVFYLIALISALVVMSGIFANKIVQFGPLTVPAGVLTFSMIFFATDLISEKWGKKTAKQAIWAGFFSNLVFVISIFIVIHWQAPPFASEAAEMFNNVLALTPRIILAGFVAYLVSQNHDVWLFHFLKNKTEGRHLWLRNNLSTATSQLIDSVVFVGLAFYGVFPILPLILGQWLVKIIIAVIDTPFIYLALWLMDKVEIKEE